MLMCTHKICSGVKAKKNILIKCNKDFSVWNVPWVSYTLYSKALVKIILGGTISCTIYTLRSDLLLYLPSVFRQTGLNEQCSPKLDATEFCVWSGSALYATILIQQYLTLSTLGKIFSRRHFEIFFLFFSENRIWHFMQIVSYGDNLHEMSNPVFWEK